MTAEDLTLSSTTTLSWRPAWSGGSTPSRRSVSSSRSKRTRRTALGRAATKSIPRWTSRSRSCPRSSDLSARSCRRSRARAGSGDWKRSHLCVMNGRCRLSDGDCEGRAAELRQPEGHQDRHEQEDHARQELANARAGTIVTNHLRSKLFSEFLSKGKA